MSDRALVGLGLLFLVLSILFNSLLLFVLAVACGGWVVGRMMAE